MTSENTSTDIQFKLKESDIQNLRTGLPVAYSGDFYPNIGRYIRTQSEKASSKKSYTSFSKLVIASFGDGKSTLCRGIEHQWLGAGLPVANIYIHNDAKLNNLHFNLIKALRTKDHNFFNLLLEVAKQRGNASKNQIIRWAYNNHEQLSLVVDDPDLQEGFWEWFADEKIMKFNRYLSSKNINQFVNKNNKNESRNFLYNFCNELTLIGMPPLLIIDELESISSFRTSTSGKAVTTQLREIIDETDSNYSLIITSTLDFFRMLQTDYAAVYNRLYNEPAKSASVTTWHLKHVRDEDAMKDFFRLIKNSGADWKSISDEHTEQAISYFIPKGQADTVELRSSVRDYINLLDESVADGDYRGFLLDCENEQDEPTMEQPQTKQLKDLAKQFAMRALARSQPCSPSVIEQDLEHEFDPLSDTPFDCDPSNTSDDESIDSYADTLPESLYMGTLPESLEAPSQDSDIGTDADTSINPDDPLSAYIWPQTLKEDHQPEAIEKEGHKLETVEDEASINPKEQNAHTEAFSKLISRAHGHTIESFANRLTSMREIVSLRIITSETASTLKPQPELDYKPVKFTNDNHSGYRVALHSQKPDQHFLVISRNRDEVDSWYALTELLLKDNKGAKTISELRRLAYISMTMAGEAVDDVDIDRLVLSIVSDMNGLASESRDGPLFLKPHRALFSLGGRTQLDTKQTRYMDKLFDSSFGFDSVTG